MAQRIAFVVSTHADELSGGPTDVRQVFSLFVDPELGACANQSPLPLEDCATRASFHQAWHSVIRNWQSQDQLLLYFSGHGSIRNSKYALVFGAKPHEEYLPFDHIASDMHAHGVRRAVLIIDACHSGAATLPGSKELGLAAPNLQHVLPEGIVVLTSSRESEFSFEFEEGERGSVFTHLLCEAIRTGLGGKPTDDDLIGADDVIAYINTRLSQPEFANYPQSPSYWISSANRTVWIARNRTKARPPSAAFQPAARSLQELQLLYERTHHSRHPCPGATVDCLDWALVQQFAKAAGTPVEAGESREQVARRLGFYSSLSDVMLHNATVLCFASAPHHFVPQARSTFVRGRRSGREVQRTDALGPLSQQIHQLTQLVLDEVQRDVAWSAIPATERELLVHLVREVTSNAVAHRDYGSSQHVQVSVDLPSIEFKNPGGFPRGLSFDELLAAGHYSLPHDPAIAWYLTTLLAYEGVGRGFSVYREVRSLLGESCLSCTEDQSLGSVTLILHVPALQSASSRSCARCGQENPAKHAFCSECGGVLALPRPSTRQAIADASVSSVARSQPATTRGQRLEPELDTREGMVLGGGRYVLKRRIGTGGAGTVYVAQDTRLHRNVAIKLLSMRFASSELQLRFEREAKATATIHHEGIVKVLDAGSEHEHMYMVMELVDGVELGQVIDASAPLRRADAPAFFLLAACLTPCVDWYHVVEKLWEAGGCLHPEGSAALRQCGRSSRAHSGAISGSASWLGASSPEMSPRSAVSYS